jgi:hypothetical protein
VEAGEAIKEMLKMKKLRVGKNFLWKNKISLAK